MRSGIYLILKMESIFAKMLIIESITLTLPLFYHYKQRILKVK